MYSWSRFTMVNVDERGLGINSVAEPVNVCGSVSGYQTFQLFVQIRVVVHKKLPNKNEQ